MMNSLFHLDVAALTDVGRRRSNNEDCMTSIVPEDPAILARKGALLIVADGLGGHEKGEVASEMVVEAVSKLYYQDENEDIADSLLRAVRQANVSLYEVAGTAGTTVKLMGTTCIAAVLQGDTAYIANIGDSRAYIVREGQARQVSQDHSWVAEQVRAGLLTEEQARVHPQRNVITRCMGSRAEVDVDVFTETVQEGDALLLCTDGLSGVVSDNDISTILEQYGSEESVSYLIARANENGGPDNITAVVARVLLS